MKPNAQARYEALRSDREDYLQMGNDRAKVSLGAITSMVGNWQQAPANGIFGVAYSSLNCLPASMQSTDGEDTCQQNAMTTFLTSNNLVSISHCA